MLGRFFYFTKLREGSLRKKYPIKSVTGKKGERKKVNNCKKAKNKNRGKSYMDLPRGVVSKKDMGDLRILMSIVLCNNEAAFNVNTLQR